VPHSLVLGGIRSGKSQLAETLVTEGKRPVTYIATATAGDTEMHARIQLHQQRRPEHWGLIEEPLALGEVLNTRQGAHKDSAAPSLLIDCMSLWLSNLLHAGEVTFQQEKEDFLAALDNYSGDVVIVSNEVGFGIIGMDPLTRRFADELGWLNQALAQKCDRVVLTVAGLPQVLKGGIGG
jgi:adenosylcobinamide kinase / adenosylcobinamide-phosphate guanylyltransferase